MNNILCRFLFLMVLLTVSKVCYAVQDTARIYFKLDNPHLDKKATDKLDMLLYNDIINAGQELLIIGYADHLGSNGYNDTLSTRRAESVRNYLMEMGIVAEKITLCVGKGEVSRDRELPDGYAADRRVDIVNITELKKANKPVVVKEKNEPAVKQESRDAVRFNASVVFDPEKVQVGQLFVLDKIFFHTGRHVIVKESEQELDHLYKIMNDNPGLVIRIEGHVCCVPRALDALDMDTGEVALSVNRARYIYNYLIKKGIERDRLAYEGYGKSRPLSPQEFTQEQQDMNKRVEIRIVQK